MCAMIFKRKNDYTKEARKCQHLFSKKEKKTYIKICLKIEESLLKYLKIMYNLKKTVAVQVSYLSFTQRRKSRPK